MEKKCNCEHGTGSAGLECLVDGSDHCSACDDGYRLSEGRTIYATGVEMLWDKRIFGD